jgi:tetratricopeptide (TPR) repeat protein
LGICHKKLLVFIDQVLVLDAGDVQLWCLKGLVLYLMEQYEEAIAAFNGALTHDPNFLDAWYLKGISLCMLKRHEEALDAFDRGWPHGNAWRHSIIRMYFFMFSNPVWAWYLKGVSIEKVKGREQALVAFEYAMDMLLIRGYRRHPHPDLVSNDSFFHPGSFQKQQKPDEEVAEQNDRMVITIDYIVDLYPEDVLVWYYKGVMLYLMEKYDKALVAFDRTLELDPHYIDAWQSKVYSFLALGQYNEEAAEALSHVPHITSQRFEGYSLSIWQRYLGAFDRTRMLYDDQSAWRNLSESVQNGHIQDPQIIREIANRFAALANDIEAAAKVPSAWIAIYTLMRNGHIQDSRIIRKIANRFEALANDIEAAAKVDFDPVSAAQNLHKRSNMLEIRNNDEEAFKTGDETSSEDYIG